MTVLHLETHQHCFYRLRRPGQLATGVISAFNETRNQHFLISWTVICALKPPLPSVQPALNLHPPAWKLHTVPFSKERRGLGFLLSTQQHLRTHLLFQSHCFVKGQAEHALQHQTLPPMERCERKGISGLMCQNGGARR